MWRPSVRIIAARHRPIVYLERAATPADVEANLELARFTDGAAGAMLDAYRSLPNEDRLSGPGSGLVMPSWIFPAPPGRFSTGTRGGTYYAAGDEATARAETVHHFVRDVEASPAALAAALAAGEPPRRMVQVIAADVLALCYDVRGLPERDAIYDPDDYAAGQRLEASVRAMPADGIVYRSVRRRAPERGECVAIYRPRAIRDARIVGTLRYRWTERGRAEVDAG